ncbi:MAG TPA: hypothetical protein VFI82_01435 [Terriglobales bacterium]|jgi:hypothetical protein|nr:hypothetical protein [Terriglobales bacterium]
MKNLLILVLCAGMASSVAAQTSSTVQLAEMRGSPAPEALNPEPTPSVGLTASLPAGTAVKMRLETTISTRTSKAGDRFSGLVTEAVKFQGRTIVPVGAALEGRIARASERRRIWGKPTIDLRPDTIVMPNGNRFSFTAVVVDTNARPEVDVNDEGQLKGRGHDGGDWKETGLAAGGGALGGSLIAGPEGALIGAGVGATASAVHWLIKTRSATLPAGTEIEFELSRPMSLGAGSDAQ